MQHFLSVLIIIGPDDHWPMDLSPPRPPPPPLCCWTLWASSPAENVCPLSPEGVPVLIWACRTHTHTHTHLSLKVILRSDEVSWAHLKGKKCCPLIRPFSKCQKEMGRGSWGEVRVTNKRTSHWTLGQLLRSTLYFGWVMFNWSWFY